MWITLSSDFDSVITIDDMFVSASKNSAGIIADVLLRYTTPSFEALTNYYLFASTSAIFIARTLSGRPNNVMNPSASWWSYKSPVVKLASDSL